MAKELYTRGQLEREISQKIQAFYRFHLEHQPSKVISQLFDTKLAIIIEDSMTSAEQILVEKGQNELAKKVRLNIHNAIEPELKKLIEKVAGVEVLDMLSDATLETRRTGIIIILNQTPKIREPLNVQKIRKKLL